MPWHWLACQRRSAIKRISSNMYATFANRGAAWSKFSGPMEFNSGTARRTLCWRGWVPRCHLSRTCDNAAFWFATARAITVAKDACASRWGRAHMPIACSPRYRKLSKNLGLRKEHRVDEKRKHQARQQGDADSSLAHHRGARALPGVHRHSFFRSYAGAVRTPWGFDLKLKARGDLDVDQHH